MSDYVTMFPYVVLGGSLQRVTCHVFPLRPSKPGVLGQTTAGGALSTDAPSYARDKISHPASFSKGIDIRLFVGLGHDRSVDLRHDMHVHRWYSTYLGRDGVTEHWQSADKSTSRKKLVLCYTDQKSVRLFRCL